MRYIRGLMLIDDKYKVSIVFMIILTLFLVKF